MQYPFRLIKTIGGKYLSRSKLTNKSKFMKDILSPPHPYTESN